MNEIQYRQLELISDIMITEIDGVESTIIDVEIELDNKMTKMKLIYKGIIDKEILEQKKLVITEGHIVNNNNKVKIIKATSIVKDFEEISENIQYIINKVDREKPFSKERVLSEIPSSLNKIKAMKQILINTFDKLKKNVSALEEATGFEYTKDIANIEKCIKSYINRHITGEELYNDIEDILSAKSYQAGNLKYDIDLSTDNYGITIEELGTLYMIADALEEEANKLNITQVKNNQATSHIKK